jgi:hypothetical protein
MEEQIVSNGRDVHGVLRLESSARPPSQSAGVLGRLYRVVTAISQHHFFDSKRSSFLERAIWIRARSIMKCLEWSVKSELEVAP